MAGAHDYSQTDFDHPQLSCDLVMKGGISSGVVYPLTIVELARRYRFSSIGGTSVGAIAAAVTAAAEYARANGGFQRVAALPQDIGPRLLSLFQPTPELKPVFNVFVAAVGHKGAAGAVVGVLGALLTGYWGAALVGVVPGLALAAWAAAHGAPGWAAFWLLAAVLGLVVALVVRLALVVTRDLPANGYGLCPGPTQPGATEPGLSDWLADTIDRVAGLDKGPLTFGHLANPGPGGRSIELAMMTTNLAMRRPHRLPWSNRIYLFRPQDFAKCFPARICDYLLATCEPFVPGERPADGAAPAGTAQTARPAVPAEYYYFPTEDLLPVVVATRMSLSFPFLISAVPLYARDFTLAAPANQVPRRCLFSDGGLSNNFPIQFFDHLLPNTPTFAVSLDNFNPERHHGDQVWMPETSAPTGGALLPIDDIGGTVSFAARLISAAKDWQDNLQSVLPGYRERIVHVALTPSEGGLNITMPPDVIDRLVGYGAEAGRVIQSDFDMNEHRWRRFLIAMARMEQTLDEITQAYDGAGGMPPFRDFLADYPARAQHYKQDPARLAEMLRRAGELVDLGRQWRDQPTVRDGSIPRPATDLSITPKQ